MRNTRMRRSRRSQERDDLSPYTGKIRLDVSEAHPKVDRFNLMREFPVISNGGGELFLNVTPGSVTSALDWGNLAGSYKEYRVVAMEVRYLPKFVVNDTTVYGSSGAQAISHTGSTTTPTSLSDVVSYGNWEAWYTYRPKTTTFRARGAEELQWGPITAANDIGSVVGYIIGASGSVVYGNIVCTYVVEFRNRN